MSSSTRSRTELPREFLPHLRNRGLAWLQAPRLVEKERALTVRSSLISFTPRQRHIGEPAKTAETSNFKNTVGSLKRLVGRSLSDPEVAEYEKKFINAELVDSNGSIAVKVSRERRPRSGVPLAKQCP